MNKVFIMIDGRSRPRGPRTARRRPSVAFVGGAERLERSLIAAGAELGVDVEVHDGGTGSGGRARLSAIVHRTDLVVVVTGVNSHNAVKIARREAEKSGTRVRFFKSCGTAAARALLGEVASEYARQVHAT
jgi:hypothetical protein